MDKTKEASAMEER